MQYSLRGDFIHRHEKLATIRAEIQSKFRFEVSPYPTLGTDSSKSTIITTCDRYGFPIRAAFSHETGLVYLVDRLERQAYNDFYRLGIYRRLINEYFSLSGAAIDLLAAEKQNAHQVLNAVSGLTTIPKGSTILDIGGSTGFLAQALQETFGGVATVIDPAQNELEVAASYGLHTKLGLFEEVPFGDDEKYDLVVLNRSLEHLNDLKTTFDKIQHVLKPDGYFIFDFVDFAAEMKKNISPEAVVKLDHTFYLHSTMLDTFCARVGFKVQHAVHHQRYCMLCVCRKSPIQASILSEASQSRFIEEVMAAEVDWYSMPRVISYSVEERIKHRLGRIARAITGRSGTVN